MPTIVAHTLNYPPHRRIGSELATHELLKWFAGKGWTAIARPATQPVSVPMCSTYELDGVIVDGSPIHELPRPDVVLHGAAHWTTAQAHAYAAGALQVMWLHGGTAFASYTASQIAAAGPDLVLANSLSAANGLRTYVQGVPIDILHPPIFPGDHMVGQACPPYRDGCVTLVNTTEAKGGPLFAELAGRMPDLKFVGVQGGYGEQLEGDGPNYAPNLWSVRHGHDMDDIWRHTAILVVPSTDESWSMAAQEALHRGIPVVGMAVPGLMECLGYELDGTPGPFAMPTVRLDEGVAGWSAVLRTVLLDWDRWSQRALDLASWHHNSSDELAALEEYLLKTMQDREGK
jgi:hypothetical protein